MDYILTPREAASHANCSVEYLMRQTKSRTGPSFFRPSPRKTLFRKSAIDRWVAGWLQVDPTKNATTEV
jgi:hypothetical protein